MVSRVVEFQIYESKVLTMCVEIQDLRCLDIVLLLGCLSDARGIHLGNITQISTHVFNQLTKLSWRYCPVHIKRFGFPIS
jgi:hypothetical protein